jgi:hypothetical protein
MQDVGAHSVQVLHEQLWSGLLRYELFQINGVHLSRMEIRSGAAIREGNVHDLITVGPV